MKKILSLVLTALMLLTVLPFSAFANETANNLGDINGNDKIDMTDYILLKRAYFGTYTFDEKQNIAGDINKNGKIDMTDYILLKRVYFGTYKIGDEVPEVNIDYIQNPTQADFDEFYDMIDYEIINWGSYWDDYELMLNKYNLISLVTSYYSYFGFEKERLNSVGDGCGDPLGRFIIKEDPYIKEDPLYIKPFVYADVYDAESLQWIANNIFNKTLVFPDDENSYCYEGKYYVAEYIYGMSGEEDIYVQDKNQQHEYLNDGKYKFTFYVEIGRGWSYEIECYTSEFVAIPKRGDNGTYWQIQSYEIINEDRYFIEDEWY